MNLESLQKINRYQACLSHFVISLMIFLFLLGIIVFIWYPGDLIHAGGWQGIKIVAGVDLVLGPLLTLVIYNPKKKSLPFDLLIIALIQMSALGYGVWNVYNEKPLALVLSYDGLHILTKGDFKHFDIGPVRYKNKIGTPPFITIMSLPDDEKIYDQIAFTSEFIEEYPFIYRTDLYITKLKESEKSKYYEIFKYNNDSNHIRAPILNKHLDHRSFAIIDISQPRLNQIEL